MPSADKPRRPAVYARVSLDRDGLSIGVGDQVEQAKAWAVSEAWPEPTVYPDNDVSASNRRKKRPAFERLLVDIANGAVDAIIVRHLDRLLRRLDDLERVLRAIEAAPGEVRVLLLQGGALDLDSSEGRLLARVLTSVAANETELKVERLLAARARDAKAGRAHQALGYGYNADKSINQEQATVVRRVAERLLEDDQSWGLIVKDLNADGIPTPWSGKWVGKTVESLATEWGRVNHPELNAVVAMLRKAGATDERRLLNALTSAGSHWTADDLRAHPNYRDVNDPHIALTLSQASHLLTAAGLEPPARGWTSANLRTMMARGALCGWRDHAPGHSRNPTTLRGRKIGEMVAKGDWEPILDKTQVEAIRARIATGGRQSEVRHLLSGFLVCTRCGRKMVGSFSSDPRVVGRRGGTTWRYACPRGGNRAVPGCGLSVAGEAIDETVTGWFLAALADTDLLTRALRQSDDPRLPETLTRLSRVDAERDRLTNMYRRGSLSPERWEAEMDELARVEREDRALIEASVPSQDILDVISGVPADTEDFDDWWDAMDLMAKRQALRAFITSIPLHPSPTGKGRATPPRERLGHPNWRV